jgi:hypothetical protein
MPTEPTHLDLAVEGEQHQEAISVLSPITPSESTALMGTILTLTAKAREAITAAKFNRLVKEWKEKRPHSSSVEQLSMHWAYQQIIGLGLDAVPLLLRELETTPGQWFWALRSITGENPVANEHRGDLRKMADDWFVWARRNGFQW